MNSIGSSITHQNVVPCQFEDLPDEVISLIFKNLATFDHQSVAGACRRFYYIIHNKAIPIPSPLSRSSTPSSSKSSPSSPTAKLKRQLQKFFRPRAPLPLPPSQPS